MKKSLGAQTLAYPAPTWIVCTYDGAGRANAMTAAWAGICCSRPPCVAVSLREATYTYASLVRRKAFTLNIPSEDFVVQADYLGIVSGSRIDKLAVAGLTALRSTAVDAPYIQQFPLVLECNVIHTVEIGLHRQFIGEIIDVKAEESILDEQGRPNIEKLRPILFSPHSHKYHGIGRCLGDAFSLGRRLGH
jgi:flavin reductase (DIM6/NTAB) family NADH-FMN oxidoreductase RutF